MSGRIAARAGEPHLQSGSRTTTRTTKRYGAGARTRLAGKLAIAGLAVTTEDEVHELERAGVDAVIVGVSDVSPLAGKAPREV